MQIGEVLREAREEQGLSLDDIQEITKIQKRYLVAIEQDDFHALPGRFYARAFIKEYAYAVGLDPEIVLKDFDEESIQAEEEETVQYTRRDRTKQAREKGSYILSFLPTIIVVILVIGIIFVAYTLMQKSSSDQSSEIDTPKENDEIVREKDNESKDEGETEEEEEKEEEEDTTDEEEDEEERFEVVDVGEGGSPLSEVDFYSNKDEIILELEPSTETYIQLLSDNEEVLYEGSMAEGSEIEEFDVSDLDKVYINVGNAAGLTISINGEELEYPVDKNERVHQKIWINFKE